MSELKESPPLVGCPLTVVMLLHGFAFSYQTAASSLQLNQDAEACLVTDVSVLSHSQKNDGSIA